MGVGIIGSTTYGSRLAGLRKDRSTNSRLDQRILATHIGINFLEAAFPRAPEIGVLQVAFAAVGGLQSSDE
jgi:hypothetical protein